MVEDVFSESIEGMLKKVPLNNMPEIIEGKTYVEAAEILGRDPREIYIELNPM